MTIKSLVAMSFLLIAQASVFANQSGFYTEQITALEGTNDERSISEILEKSKSFEELLKKGDPRTQYEIGKRFYQGKVVPKNLPEAYKWIKKSADQGHYPAQNLLGLMYSYGLGMKSDPEKAIYWYTLAAKQGDVASQFNLGNMYLAGKGVPVDYYKAHKWYLLAAKQGDANAQFNIGTMYAKGTGVEQNNAEAVKWYLLSAKQGDLDAMTNLAYKYFHGVGVKQDYVKAYMWWKVASYTDQWTGRNSRIVVPLLTADQRAEADSQAKECYESSYVIC